MSEPTFEEMRQACWRYYNISHRGEVTTDRALALLREVSKRAGWSITIAVSGWEPGPAPFTVYVSDLTQVLPDMFEGTTLGEAAIRCAYAQISKETRE